MIVDRTTLNCKWGRGDEVVALFKEMMSMPPPEGTIISARILTDLSGDYFRVILETEMESLAAWEKWRSEMFSTPEFGELFAKTTELIDSGSVEFFTVEAKF